MHMKRVVTETEGPNTGFREGPIRGTLHLQPASPVPMSTLSSYFPSALPSIYLIMTFQIYIPGKISSFNISHSIINQSSTVFSSFIYICFFTTLLLKENNYWH